jgi:hypothetical protein
LPKVELRLGGGTLKIVAHGKKPISGTYTIEPLKKQIILRPKMEKAMPMPISHLWRGDRLRLQVDSLTLSKAPTPQAPSLYLDFERLVEPASPK